VVSDCTPREGEGCKLTKGGLAHTRWRLHSRASCASGASHPCSPDCASLPVRPTFHKRQKSGQRRFRVALGETRFPVNRQMAESCT